MSTKKAVEALQRSDGQESNTQEGDQTMTILAPTLDYREPFDATLTVDVRHAGGTLFLEPEHVDWLGRDLIKLEIPGLTLHLAPHEARDLANALQCLAQHIDEEQPRELQRPTDLAAAPETDGIGGGL